MIRFATARAAVPGPQSHRGSPAVPRRVGARAPLRILALCMVSLAGLSACTVQPKPLTPEQTALRIEADRERLEANQPPLDGPLTVHGAMARALLHNLDARVLSMERGLALRQLDMARLGLLPRMTGRYGVDSRNNTRASSSRRLGGITLPSDSASTSTDDTFRSGNLAVVWHALDFGVSYYAAKQQTDRALIAEERRRRAVHETVWEVRRAWWRAVAADRALAGIDPLAERVHAALADSARIADLQVQSPLEALRYQRTLLEALQALEVQRRESRLAKIELAALIGVAPGTDYALAVPGQAALEPRSLPLSAADLEAHALAWRPELRQAQIEERIAAGEVKKAMLRILPGLELEAGAHYDSNSYLVNNDWFSLGARISLNLTEIFTAPAATAAARASRELAVARREALSMAVLTQLYVALASFEEARAHHDTASRIADTHARIAALLRSSSRLGVVDELQLILGELDALRSALARDLSYAEVENSFGRIFVAAGADIPPGENVAPTLQSLAAAIAATEDAWARGEIAVQSHPEPNG